MKCIVARSFDEAEAMWRSFEAVAECWPFQHFDFLSTWHRTIGNDEQIAPCIARVDRDDGRPLMLLPLGIERRGSMRVLSWLGGQVADYKGPLLLPDASEELISGGFATLWRNVLRELPAFDTIHFDSQPELIGSQRNPFTTLAVQDHPSSAHYSLLDGDLSSYVASKRSSKSRWQMRRKYARLKELGAVEWVMPVEESGIVPVMSALFEQKSRNYAELGVRDLFARPAYREFYLEMAKEHARSGLVNLSALTLNGEVVAAHWGLVARKRFFFLMPSYADGEVQRYSPGNILLQHLFEWCFENGIEAFDFTVGDETYKQHWCDHELKLFDHTQGATIMGMAHSKVISTSTRLKRALKTSDTVWPLAERARAALGNLSRRGSNQTGDS